MDIVSSPESPWQMRKQPMYDWIKMWRFHKGPWGIISKDVAKIIARMIYESTPIDLSRPFMDSSGMRWRLYHEKISIRFRNRDESLSTLYYHAQCIRWKIGVCCTCAAPLRYCCHRGRLSVYDRLLETNALTQNKMYILPKPPMFGWFGPGWRFICVCSLYIIIMLWII